MLKTTCVETQGGWFCFFVFLDLWSCALKGFIIISGSVVPLS